jgi:hypothetical protein
MPPRPYYDVDRRINFFGLIGAENSEIKPEEKVRQWAIAELQASYGIPVTQITVEHGVKVGSKNYRIDILVKRDGYPFIAIECKHQNFNQHHRALEQSISYAAAPQARAEFAVYTNGSEWMVRRLVGGHWVSVTDIPIYPRFSTTMRLQQFFGTLESIKPLLYWIDQPFDYACSRKYFAVLQEFFTRGYIIQFEFISHLECGVDYLLRVLSHNAIQKDKYYANDKLTAAFHVFLKSWKDSGIVSDDLYDNLTHLDMQDLIVTARSDMEMLVENADGVDYGEQMVIRIATVLYQIAYKDMQKKSDIRREMDCLLIEVRKLLEYHFIRTFGVKLDDSLIVDDAFEISRFCKADWLASTNGWKE